MRKLLLLSTIFIALTSIKAQENEEISQENIDQFNKLFYQDSIVKQFKYLTGKVIIGNNLAEINVPEGWLFIQPNDAKILMEDIYNNEPNIGRLGILVPDTPSMLNGIKWLVEYNYSSDGHVKDDDAKDINYDDLAKDLKKAMEESNPERVKNGYSSINFIGWAQKPFYDETNKKLHWAKELELNKNPEHTLNYDIRILGREGFLEMVIISEMAAFNDVKQDVDQILKSTNFIKGNRYEDYDSSTDKLAEYGIGGLVAGGVLAKTGILAKIGVFLLKFLKIIIVAVGGIIALVSKRFFKKKDTAINPNEDNNNSNINLNKE